VGNTQPDDKILWDQVTLWLGQEKGSAPVEASFYISTLKKIE